MQQQGPWASRYGLENHGISNPRAVWWNLSTPAPCEQVLARFEGMPAYLEGKDLFVQDCTVGADPAHQLTFALLEDG